MGTLVNYEWLLIELFVVGLAVFELVNIRRIQRKDREKAEQAKSAPPENPS